MRSQVADPTTFDRHRRLRRGAALRSLVREHRIDPRSLVLPVFVDARITAPEPISSLPGHSRWPARDTVALAAGCYFGTSVTFQALAKWGLRYVEFDQTGPPPEGVQLVWLQAPSNPFLTMPSFEARPWSRMAIRFDTTSTHNSR